jgi:hypothetical protein
MGQAGNRGRKTILDRRLAESPDLGQHDRLYPPGPAGVLLRSFSPEKTNQWVPYVKFYPLAALFGALFSATVLNNDDGG